MKKVLLGIAAIAVVFGLVACGNKEEKQPETSGEANQVVENNEATENNEVVDNNEEENVAPVTSGEETNVPKSEQEGTAGSNIPLKDNLTEAEYQIKVAMQDLLKETYGDQVFDARINVTKMYTAEEEQDMPALKERNLGANEVAFEVNYEIKPAEGVDPIIFTAATGEYDEESGWVKEKYNCGILVPNESGDAKFKIVDFGTGF